MKLLRLSRRFLSNNINNKKSNSYPYVKALKSSDIMLKNKNPKIQELLDEILRVDHAGEYGAVRIYEGQLAFTKDRKQRKLLVEMKEQEEAHLQNMNTLVSKYRSRPTLFHPLWHIAGYTLGAVTSFMGKEAAMACTVAVEEVICEHYDDQLRELHKIEDFDGKEEIKKVIKANRDDEAEHRDTALNNGAQQAPLYELLTSTIKTGCHAAIWVAKRI